MFTRFLNYKAEWNGKNIVQADRWFASSKTCSVCSQKYEGLTLDQREWTCENCGAFHDRDINAAINIKSIIQKL